MNFNSHTDAVVATTVAFVNALTPGHRRGKPYPQPHGEERAQLLATVLTPKQSSHQFTAGQSGAFASMALQLREVFEALDRGEMDNAAGRINAILHRTQARPMLIRHDGEPWHIHFHAASHTSADNWSAGFATALAIVIGSEYADRLGVCNAPACDRVYVDTSRNGTRRFCSTSCQNRVKSAAFRHRRQSAMDQ